MKNLILSVSAKDCDWSFARGSGKGGQKRNKTSTAARCKHKPSGAMGYSDDTREQRKNKELAFRHMIETPEFNTWHVKELARIEGWCNPDDLKVEVGKNAIKNR